MKKLALPRDEQTWQYLCRNKLEQMLLQYNQNPSIQPPLSEHIDLVEDLQFDSLTMMTFIVQMEEEFDVVVGGKEIADNVLKTFSRLLHFVIGNSTQG